MRRRGNPAQAPASVVVMCCRVCSSLRPKAAPMAMRKTAGQGRRSRTTREPTGPPGGPRPPGPPRAG
eukprot:2690887-Lingulodinium_polyedra.AAC.1